MKKLAITISGAVSLGAYEAGVMYELLQALQTHNQSHPDNPILIDVLTGASAGGMTAVILAQKLLFQSERLQNESDNDLYLPWIKDIDLTGLLKQNPSESPQLSMLSSDLVESTSRKYLTSALGASPPNRHPAADTAIKLGLAMSNLNGIDYGLPLLTGGAMPYTRFQDEVKADVDSINPDHAAPDFWEPLRSAAVACGAFPFAFRVKELLRQAADFQDPPPLNPFKTNPQFAYTDGGTFQNEPIALAKQLVDDIDQHLSDDRYFLFIAPGMRASAANDDTAAPGSDDFDYLNTGKSLASAVFNQARYRDLDNVEKINQRVAQFDEQADGLKELFLTHKVNAAALTAATAPLLSALFPGPIAGQLSDAGNAARARLKLQFVVEYAALTTAVGKPDADAWIDAILLFESTASLGPHDTMKVFAITEDADKLAGDDLFAFGGFFDIAYRQHDYDRGRQSARDFLRWLNQTQNTGLGPVDYPIDNLPPLSIDPKLDKVQITDLPRDKRQQFRDRLHDRLGDIMNELDIPWLIQKAIELGYLNKSLDKLLDL